MTPKSFLSFLEGYKTLYADKLANLNELAARMTTGLLKLDEASESVDELSKELVVKEKDLVVANQKADKVRMITDETSIVTRPQQFSVSVQVTSKFEPTSMLKYNTVEYVRNTYSSQNRIRIWYVWYAYSIFENRRSVALKYYIVKLTTASRTFGNNVKITSFPAWIYKQTVPVPHEVCRFYVDALSAFYWCQHVLRMLKGIL